VTGATQIGDAFGRALVSNRLITPDALQSARARAIEHGIALHDAVVGGGLLDERTSYSLLARVAGMSYVDLEAIDLSPLARRLVPASVLHRHHVLPVAVDDRVVTYATAGPGDRAADRAVSVAAGRAALAVVTCRSHLRTAIAVNTPAGGHPAPSPVDGHAATRPGSGAARPSVLIVEDDPTTRTLVRLLLERDGCEVLEAADGRHALAVAAGRDLDAVVMDLLMPRLDGYGAIGELRRQPRHARTPIVVVTTEEGPVVERTVIALGADDYILKPFEPTVLTSRIKAALRRQRATA
jgi:CheY-like chemotaxis protein